VGGNRLRRLGPRRGKLMADVSWCSVQRNHHAMHLFGPTRRNSCAKV
jgi:hypothetical protein